MWTLYTKRFFDLVDFELLQSLPQFDGQWTQLVAAPHLDAGALFYRHGDFVHAAVDFGLAAEQGNALAQCWLGLCYQHGKGVEKDERRAAILFLRAAKQGHAAGQCMLGGCYELGRGVEKNKGRAVKLYRIAAEQGHALGCSWLARCLKDSRDGEKDVVHVAEV